MNRTLTGYQAHLAQVNVEMQRHANVFHNRFLDMVRYICSTYNLEWYSDPALCAWENEGGAL